MRGRLVLLIVGLLLFLGGCGPPKRSLDRICPGTESLNEALFELRRGWDNAVALKANGQCRLRFHSSKRRHDENFLVRVWVNPPDEICLQGDIAFNAKGIVLGANDVQFWLVTRPKEFSQYLWGRWDRQSGFDSQLVLSPRVLMEALGMVAVGPDADSSGRWSLSNEGACDVLTERGQAGQIVKKIYIYNCDRRVWRTEYFDADGRTVVTTELDKYRDVAEGFAVPTDIKMVMHRADDKTDSVRLTLRAKSVSLSDKARQRLFSRPPPRGIEPVEVVDGSPVDQPQ
jgi:hypothetical protein